MESWLKARAWLDDRRATILDLVRIYLGVALFIQGCTFIHNDSLLLDSVGAAHIPFSYALIHHYVVIAHLGGGALMAAGLLTRIAAAVQLPALAGAVVFVHLPNGLFTRAQTLEFTLLVLFLLVVFRYPLAGSPRLAAVEFA
jgi:putative oxidoreductase